MAGATADTVKMGIIPETVFGTTPTTPAFQQVRMTGESVAFAPTTVDSAELTPGRGVADSALVGGEVSGDMNYELTKNPAFETLLQCAMCSDFGDSFSGGTMPAGWDSDWVALGQELKSVTLFKEFPVDGTIAAQVYPGLVVNTLALTVTPGQIVTGVFGFIGGTMATRVAEFTGQTWAAPGANPVFTAPKVVSVDFRGLDLTTALGIGLGTHCFNNLVVNLNNNVRARECIGFLGARERVLGRANVNVTASIYFTNNDLLDMLIDQDEFSIDMVLADSAPSPANHRYHIVLPRCKLTAAPVTAGGTNQDVNVEGAINCLQPKTFPFSPMWIERQTV